MKTYRIEFVDPFGVVRLWWTLDVHDTEDYLFPLIGEHLEVQCPISSPYQEDKRPEYSLRIVRL